MQLFIHLTVPGIDTQMDGYLEGGTIPRPFDGCAT